MHLFKVTLNENKTASVNKLELDAPDTSIMSEPYESPEDYYFITENNTKKAIHKKIIGHVLERNHEQVMYLLNE